MMKRTFVFLSAAVIVMMICGTSRAANVTAAGSTLDLTPTIDATSAGIGQTVLGTLFWDYENGPQSSGSPDDLVNNQRNNLPDYVTFGAGADLQGTSGGWGYQQVIDDFGGPFESGTLASNAGPRTGDVDNGRQQPNRVAHWRRDR